MGLFKPKLRADIAEKANRQGVRVFVSVPCTDGLPVPEGTLCQIYYFDDHIEVVAGGVEYALRMEKIRSVSIETSGKTQTQYVSSAGGAMLGAAVAGPVGAAFGGRVKEKSKTTITSYLVFSYTNKDGEAASMAFDATHTPKCRDMVQVFEADQKCRSASGPVDL